MNSVYDKEYHRIHWKKYYAENREHILKARKERRKNTLEPDRDRRKKYYYENREEELKKNSAWSKENRKIINKRKHERLLELQQWYKEQKINKPCEVCGRICVENNIESFSFHHINPKDKKYSIARMINNTMNKDTIIKEMKKCIIVCENCHRHIHYMPLKEKLEFNNNVEKAIFIRKKWYVERMKNEKCEVCGEHRQECLDWHHENNKIQTIGYMLSHAIKQEKIEEEIKKCRCLCAVCHRTTHQSSS